MLMDLETNMKAIGKRLPYLARYKLASTKEGLIKAIDIDVFADCGCNPYEQSIILVRENLDNGECTQIHVIN